MSSIPGVRGGVATDVSLAECCTYRIGGPAAYLVTPIVAEDVAAALRFASTRELPWLALGLGSNVLIADRGFPGVVIRLGKGLDAVRADECTWRVGAGLPTPLLAKRTAEQGLAGAERLVGVPGTVGGGVFMNAGCHGQDFAGIVQDISVVTASGEDRVMPRAAVPFRYRGSGLEGMVVVGATLQFTEAAAAELKREQQALFRWRRSGTPFDQRCCGSVFRNPPGDLTAGTLIDRCGLKGFRIGGAQVSPLHANYIVNTGGASAADVHRVIDHVRREVERRHGVTLELEVRLIGD